MTGRTLGIDPAFELFKSRALLLFGFLIVLQPRLEEFDRRAVEPDLSSTPLFEWQRSVGHSCRRAHCRGHRFVLGNSESVAIGQANFVDRPFQHHQRLSLLTNLLGIDIDPGVQKIDRRLASLALETAALFLVI